MDDAVTTSGGAPGGLPVPGRSRTKTVLLGAVLLISGMVIGSGLTLIGLKRRADEFRQRPEMFSSRILSKMETDLKLTKEQKAELAKIFKEAREELDDVRRQHRAQGQAYFRDFHDEVARVLTVKQQAEWEEWWKRARERAWKDRGGSGGPPRPGDRDGRDGPDGPNRRRGPGELRAPEMRDEPPDGPPPDPDAPSPPPPGR